MSYYALHLARAWRWIYVVCGVLALYLNVFVAVVQAFRKVSALNALAPTQKEPPFPGFQVVVMTLFVVLDIFAVRTFNTRVATA